MSERRSRDRGARVERAVVNALKAEGFPAVRVPLSGAAGGRFGGDIIVPVRGRDLCGEVKARAGGFRQLYGWLEGCDLLVLKADTQPPLVVLRLDLAVVIMGR
jgi:hypothetical protein